MVRIRARGLAAVFLAGSLALPGEPLPTPAVRPAAGKAPARPATRQEKLEPFRAAQAEIRTLKKQARLVRRFRLQAEAKARERAFRAWRGRVEAGRKQEAAARPGAWWKSRTGLLVLVAGGMVYLLDPSSVHAWAQAGYGNGPASDDGLSSPSAPGPSYAGYDLTPDLAAARAALAQVGPACAQPLADLLGLQACAPEAQAGLLAQIDDLEAQTLQLFVPPRSLGAGGCLPGESQARERSQLFQASRSLQYDQLYANALALRYQFLAVGLEFRAVGRGLLAGQFLSMPLAGNRSLVAASPSPVFVETGDIFNLVGYVITSAGNGFGVLAADAEVCQSDYQTWARGQAEGLLACNGTEASLPTPAPVPALGSPLPVLAELLAGAQLCLAAAVQFGADVSCCGAPLAARVQARNGTLAGFYQQSTCLAAGQAAGCPPGRNAAPDAAMAMLRRYADQLDGARYLGLALGDSICAGGQGLRVVAEPLDAAGDTQGAAGLFAGADLLLAIGTAVRSNAYALDAIGAAERSRAAALGLEANAQRWAQLDQEEARERAQAPGSSTGTGLGDPDGSASAQAPTADASADTGPLAASSTAGEPSGSTATVPAPSPAVRARPLLILVLGLGRIIPGVR